MSDTQMFGLVNGLIVGTCVSRVVDVREKYNLEIEFGQVFAFDRLNKMWFGLYSHHFGNYDDDDNLYDSYSQLDRAYAKYADGEELTGRKALELDGDKFKWLKEEPTNDTYKFQEVYKYLNKHYKNNNTADLIYVRNYGYAMPPEYKLIDWDVAEKEIEKELIERKTFRP